MKKCIVPLLWLSVAVLASTTCCSTPSATLETRIQNLVNETVKLETGQYYDIAFSVDENTTQHLRVTGIVICVTPGNRDIQVLVIDDASFKNWVHNGSETDNVLYANNLTGVTNNIDVPITTSGRYGVCTSPIMVQLDWKC